MDKKLAQLRGSVNDQSSGPASVIAGGAACPLHFDIHVPIMPTSPTSAAPVSYAVPCPVVESLDAILPEEPLLMMGAGPVPIPAAVAKANAIVINHLGGTMVKVIGQVKSMARYVFQTNSKWVLGVAGPEGWLWPPESVSVAWTDIGYTFRDMRFVASHPNSRRRG